jgi:molybdopterin synthase catalytic subunit
MIRLTDEPFEPAPLLETFSRGRRETGAIVSFTGLARAEHEAVATLELEAYPGFTEAAIHEIAQEAQGRFDLHGWLIVHRVGRIAPGEAIVFVATAATHRRAAFEAADFLMDYLKSRAPFWKKSHGPDGDRWIEPSTKDYEDAARWDERALDRRSRETP